MGVTRQKGAGVVAVRLLMSGREGAVGCVPDSYAFQCVCIKATIILIGLSNELPRGVFNN